jgi:hypothetical protein
MRLGVAIARLVFPNSFVNDDQRSSHHQTVSGLGEFTLREFLSAIRTNVVSANFPNLATERQADLQDVNALLDRPFSKIKED